MADITIDNIPDAITTRTKDAFTALMGGTNPPSTDQEKEDLIRDRVKGFLRSVVAQHEGQQAAAAATTQINTELENAF